MIKIIINLLSKDMPNILEMWYKLIPMKTLTSKFTQGGNISKFTEATNMKLKMCNLHKTINYRKEMGIISK